MKRCPEGGEKFGTIRHEKRETARRSACDFDEVCFAILQELEWAYFHNIGSKHSFFCPRVSLPISLDVPCFL